MPRSRRPWWEDHPVELAYQGLLALGMVAFIIFGIVWIIVQIVKAAT